MALVVVGLSHQTAPVEVRERFAVGSEADRRALVARLKEAGAEEAVVLSTCNRTELYLRIPAGSRCSAPAAVLAERAGWSVEALMPHITHAFDDDAARHLFRVVAGLESAVLGEAQIQGQVRDAYEAAHATPGHAGPVLSRLFQNALSVGAKVRSQTSLGRGAASVPGAAVELARKVLGPLAGVPVLVIGAGAMSRLALKCLVGEGVEEPLIASRTMERASALADEVGGRAVPIEALSDLLPWVDLVVSATSAPHPVLTLQHVSPARRSRPQRRLVIADLAVPRDVDPALGSLPGTFLFDVDDLKGLVTENVQRRKADVPAAERIVEVAVAEFGEWHEARKAAELIRTIRDNAEDVRQREVARALRRLDHLDAQDRERIEELSERIMNKVLHTPTVRLKGAAGGTGGGPTLAAARYLFGVEEPLDLPAT